MCMYVCFPQDSSLTALTQAHSTAATPLELDKTHTYPVVSADKHDLGKRIGMFAMIGKFDFATFPSRILSGYKGQGC